MNDLADTVEAPAQANTDLMAPACDCPPAAADEIEAIVALRKDSPEWQQINRWEEGAAVLPQQLCPLDHVHTPGLYTRIIFMPAGTRLTSKIHLFEHPYIIASGVVRVWTLEAGWVTMRAPHVGVTKPGTRRLLEILEDTIWVTSHINPENETDPVKTYDHIKLGHMDSVPTEAMAAILENQKGKHP